MNYLTPLGLIACLLMTSHVFAAPTLSKQISQALPSSESNSLHGTQMTHNVGYGHHHGQVPRVYRTRARTRSYNYCSRNVFEPCRARGHSYRTCNRRHHMCRYGHLDNCIRGSTC